jgi:hypothetical protein
VFTGVPVLSQAEVIRAQRCGEQTEYLMNCGPRGSHRQRLPRHLDTPPLRVPSAYTGSDPGKPKWFLTVAQKTLACSRTIRASTMSSAIVAKVAKIKGLEKMPVERGV